MKEDADARNTRIYRMPVELTGDEAWALAAWAYNPSSKREMRDAQRVAERVRKTRNARYDNPDT